MNAQAQVIQKGRKFDQVLEGARQVFLEVGFEGASVDDIARAAGVSKATLYKYFPDKRLLFMEMARTECARQAERLKSEIDFEAPAPVVLEKIGRAILSVILSDVGRKVFRVFVAEAGRFPELRRNFYESGPKLMRSRMVQYLQSAVDKGELQIDDFDLAADQFRELCKAGIFMRLTFGVQEEFSPEEIERTVLGAVEMFMARYGA